MSCYRQIFREKLNFSKKMTRAKTIWNLVYIRKCYIVLIFASLTLRSEATIPTSIPTILLIFKLISKITLTDGFQTYIRVENVDFPSTSRPDIRLLSSGCRVELGHD